MVKLILTRGLPGSGKTTEAVAWVRNAPEGERRVRVNRDDLRESLFCGQGILDWPAEQDITRVQQDTVRAFLLSGVSVVVDDMNLRAKYCTEWARLAADCGADVDVLDMTHISLDECIARDYARGVAGGRLVGGSVIRDIHARFLASGRLAAVQVHPREPVPSVAPYAGTPGAPDAWIVDVDGTLALNTGGRAFYDWHRVGEDEPHAPVVRVVRALAACDDEPSDWDTSIIVMSGREDVCRAETEAWLGRNGVPFDLLLMRKAGDRRRDSIVKAELFDRYVRDVFNVQGVIDDRRQVVRETWRAMGIACFDVADGDF